MKILVGLLFLSITWIACDLNKYTNVYIDNQNNFPIQVKLKTNNVESVYTVPANSVLDTLRQFTDILFEDGKWEVTVSNAQTGQLIKQHEHGQFFKGELANRFSMKTKGNYFEFSVDN